jgi:hypothetical protein
VRSIELEDAQVGKSVRVRSDYGKQQLQGSVGTVKKRYGVPDYTVFEVSFPDGRTELFWDHQPEEFSPRHKRRWVFW